MPHDERSWRARDRSAMALAPVSVPDSDLVGPTSDVNQCPVDARVAPHSVNRNSLEGLNGAQSPIYIYTYNIRERERERDRERGFERGPARVYAYARQRWVTTGDGNDTRNVSAALRRFI
jgi:hypothetical protein